MKTTKLTEVLERIETWPADAQDDLAEFVLVLDAGVKLDARRQRKVAAPPLVPGVPPRAVVQQQNRG